MAQRQQQCQRRAGPAEDYHQRGRPLQAERRERRARAHPSAQVGRPERAAERQQPNLWAAEQQRLNNQLVERGA